jgi:hypothetical protein
MIIAVLISLLSVRIQKKACRISGRTKCYNCKGSGHYSDQCELPRVSDEQLERNKEDILQDRSRIKAQKQFSNNGQETILRNFAEITLTERSSNSVETPRPAKEGSEEEESEKEKQQAEGAKEEKAVCQYHSGRVINKVHPLTTILDA